MVFKEEKSRQRGMWAWKESGVGIEGPHQGGGIESKV